MLRWIWVVLILGVVVGGVAFFRSPTEVPVDVALAHKGDIRVYVEERAKTRVPETYRISMPLAGRVLPISLKAGDRVTKGEVVARLDPADLDRDVSQESIRVLGFDRMIETLGNSIKSSQQQLLAREAKLKFAEEEHRRISQLFEREAVPEAEKSEAELLEIESRAELRKDELTHLNYKIALALTQLFRQDQIETQAATQRDRKRAEIHSPVDGVVLEKMESNERVLPSGEVLLEIGQPDELEVEAEILAQDAVTIQVGFPVEISGAAIGAEPITGKVTRIYPRGFTKVSSLGVEQQRVKVVIAFDPEGLEQLKKAGRKLGIDYRVRIKIFTQQKQNALIIPRSAIFRSAAGNWQAMVVRDGAAQLVDLKIGLANDFEVEVLSGANDNEPVILAPDSSLVDGQPVETMLPTESQ
ncbi:putative efflux system component YknX [Symmachiella macrocystis]|uniref:Putative efflux system component YknX n=1 Tax=Symmachiella macrocystis TaxID=2527985 RepID=A0A5C6BNZ7_9PLAN|nr:HlyD family efflux transporter periplasmic adaptor subunit [Symmachiella macrocystis]TWU13778.1 putative efflux system component YknX [Symmachiella macrocystis]